jgi:hypothetical protein
MYVFVYLGSSSGWLAGTSDSNQYIEVVLSSPTMIWAIAIQGLGSYLISTYYIQYSTDGISFTTYQENSSNRLFTGTILNKYIII